MTAPPMVVVEPKASQPMAVAAKETVRMGVAHWHQPQALLSNCPPFPRRVYGMPSERVCLPTLAEGVVEAAPNRM